MERNTINGTSGWGYNNAPEEAGVCIFVANLPISLNEMDISERLKTLLSAYGTILHVKASRDSRGRPFAFVQFQTLRAEQLLGATIMLEDRTLRFERARSNFVPPPNGKAYAIGNTGISGSMRSVSGGFSSLYTAASHDHHPLVHYGGPVPFPMAFEMPSLHGTASASAEVPLFEGMDPSFFYGGMPCDEDENSTGLVPSSAIAATHDFHHHCPLRPTSSNNKVFVGHLNGGLVTQRKLLRRFQRHGHITDIELFKRNIDGSLRQEAFAFVSYLLEEQQFRAIKEENDQEWLGQRLKCCKALPKKEITDSSYPINGMPPPMVYYASPMHHLPSYDPNQSTSGFSNL